MRQERLTAGCDGEYSVKCESGGDLGDSTIVRLNCSEHIGRPASCMMADTSGMTEEQASIYEETMTYCVLNSRLKATKCKKAGEKITRCQETIEDETGNPLSYVSEMMCVKFNDGNYYYADINPKCLCDGACTNNKSCKKAAE